VKGKDLFSDIKQLCNLQYYNALNDVLPASPVLLRFRLYHTFQHLRLIAGTSKHPDRSSEEIGLEIVAVMFSDKSFQLLFKLAFVRFGADFRNSVARTPTAEIFLLTYIETYRW